jgi:histidyl-tRNA synthetase
LLRQWLQVEGNTTEVFDVVQSYVKGNPLAQAHLNEWIRLVRLLHDVYEIPESKIKFTTGLSRGWDYYTGMVFEIQANTGEVLCGGGRYDELVKLLGSGKDVGAVGFAYYVDRILSLNPPDEMLQPKRIYLKSHEQDWIGAAVWANLLRQHDVAVIVLKESENPPSGTQLLYLSEHADVIVDDKTYTRDNIELLVSYLNG